LKRLQPERIKRILVRSTNWIGDAVMTTPALGAIRETFHSAEISIVANPLVGELFAHHPYCDRVIVFDKQKSHSGIRGMLSFCRQLRGDRFDIAILLQNAFEAALMAFLSGIRVRAGYRTDGRDLLLTHGVPIGEEEKKLHHTDYYLKMLEYLDVRGGDRHLKLSCTDGEIAEARKVLGDDEWLAINPGATYGSAKRWYPDRFAAVADSLAREYSVRALIIGGPGERDVSEDIEASMESTALNLCGRTTVREMMAVLSQCRLMVTNDSGPMHVAAAFGVPIVAVFGPTDHTTTSPFSNNNYLIREEADCAPCLLRHCPTDHRCMEAINTDDVLTAARSLMEADRSRS
jgi:heptosyltransferase-2